MNRYHPFVKLTATSGSRKLTCSQWREEIRTPIAPLMHFDDGWGFYYRHNRVHYVNAVPTRDALEQLLGDILTLANLPCKRLGHYLRTQTRGSYRFAFNYGEVPIDLAQALSDALDFKHDTKLIIGQSPLGPREVAAWQVR